MGSLSPRKTGLPTFKKSRLRCRQFPRILGSGTYSIGVSPAAYVASHLDAVEHHAYLQLTMSAPAQHDDSFELYDLRVEVVRLPGEPIICGAKNGDYFTLEERCSTFPPARG